MNDANCEMMEIMEIALRGTWIGLSAANDSIKAITGYEKQIYLVTKDLDVQRRKIQSEELYIGILLDMSKLCTNNKNRKIHLNHYKSCIKRFNQQRGLLLQQEKELVKIETLAAVEKDELKRLLANCSSPDRDETIVIDNTD